MWLWIRVFFAMAHAQVTGRPWVCLLHRSGLSVRIVHTVGREGQGARCRSVRGLPQATLELYRRGTTSHDDVVWKHINGPTLRVLPRPRPTKTSLPRPVTTTVKPSRIASLQVRRSGHPFYQHDQGAARMRRRSGV